MQAQTVHEAVTKVLYTESEALSAWAIGQLLALINEAEREQADYEAWIERRFQEREEEPRQEALYGRVPF